MAAPQARRELELRLKVVTDATAAKGAMDQLAASAERVERATGKAAAALGGSGPMGRPGATAALASSLGAVTNRANLVATAAQRQATAPVPVVVAGVAPGAVQPLQPRPPSPLYGSQAATESAAAAVAQRVAASAPRGGHPLAAAALTAAAVAPRAAPKPKADTKPTGAAQFGTALASRFGLPSANMAGPAAAAFAVYQVAKTATAISAAGQDELMSDNERGRAVFKSLPFGETGLQYMDVWSGRAAGMRRAAEEGQVAAAQSQARTQFRGQQLALGAGVAQSQAQAAALNAGQATTMPVVDRRTAAGERQYRLESQMLPLRERSAAAERAAAVAAEEAVDAQRQANQLAREGEQIDRRRSGLKRDIDQASNTGTWRWWTQNAAATAREDEARRRMQDEFDRTGAERQGNAQQQVEQLRRAQEARQRQIAAEAEQRRSAADRLRVQAEDVEERAGRVSSLAQRVATSPQDRIAEAVYAAERFRRRGLRSLDPTEIALLQEFGADDLRGAAEEQGRRDPRYRRLAQLLPQTYPDGAADPEALRRRAQETRTQAAEQQYEADRIAAQQTADTVKNVAGLIERVLREAMAQVAANIRNEQQRGRGGV